MRVKNAGQNSNDSTAAKNAFWTSSGIKQEISPCILTFPTLRSIRTVGVAQFTATPVDVTTVLLTLRIVRTSTAFTAYMD